MAKYIEREKVIDELEHLHEDAELYYLGVYDCVKSVPTADVVEVVRCKDCKYQDDCAGQMVHTTRDYVLELNVSTYNKVDYCSYGERKCDK